MSDPTPLQAQIELLASQAKDVTVDGQRVIRRGLSEMIEADRYLTGRAALQANGGTGLGLQFFKIARPPGGG